MRPDFNYFLCIYVSTLGQKPLTSAKAIRAPHAGQTVALLIKLTSTKPTHQKFHYTRQLSHEESK